MRESLVIVTVGSSLLTNAGWRRGQPLPAPRDLAKTVSDALDAGPVETRQLCVETNVLVRLPEPVRRGAWLALVHSDTEEGNLVAGAIREALTRPAYSRGAFRFDPRRVELREIRHLNARNEADFERGLRNFVCELSNLVSEARHRRNLQPLVCATGGYKVQSAYAYLVGLLHRAEVSYLYETYDRALALPRLPLRVDFDRVRAEVPPSLLARLHSCERPDHGLEPGGLAPAQEALLAPFLHRDRHGRLRLNPLGEAFVDREVRRHLLPRAPRRSGVSFSQSEPGTPRDVLKWAEERLAPFSCALQVRLADWDSGADLQVRSDYYEDPGAEFPWSIALHVPTAERQNMRVKCTVRLAARCRGEAEAAREALCEHLGVAP